MQPMTFREFVHDLKERSSNVGSHVLAERWVVPKNISAVSMNIRLTKRNLFIRRP